MTLRKTYMKLALAILFEIFATTMLVLSEGFTRILPSILSIIGYGLCYYILTYVFRRMHLGVAYAIWCGYRRSKYNWRVKFRLFNKWRPLTGHVVNRRRSYCY